MTRCSLHVIPWGNWSSLPGPSHPYVIWPGNLPQIGVVEYSDLESENFLFEIRRYIQNIGRGSDLSSRNHKKGWRNIPPPGCHGHRSKLSSQKHCPHLVVLKTGTAIKTYGNPIFELLHPGCNKSLWADRPRRPGQRGVAMAAPL